VELAARLGEEHLRIPRGPRRHRARAVVARGQAGDGETHPAAADRAHDGLTRPAVSALPRVLSFSRAFTVMESPGVPPTSAC